MTSLEERMVRAWVAEQDRKLEEHLEKGGAKASPAPALSPAIEALALAIGQDRILLPPAITVSRMLTDEGDEIATSIRVGRLTFTIEEAVRLGVLDLDGRFSHYKAGLLLHSIPEPGAWVHPWGPEAAKPASRPRP